MDDNCADLERVLGGGVGGSFFKHSTAYEIDNLALTQRLLALCGADESSIRYVADRPGHDRRYSVDTRRVRALGWTPVHDLDDGLAATVAWYRDNADWWEPLLGDRP